MILIDDAQQRFYLPLSDGQVDDPFWAALIKSHTLTNPLPQNITFIICSSFPNSLLNVTDLPMLRWEDFRVEPDVARTFLHELGAFWSDEENVPECRAVLSDERVQNLFITECSGSAGALKISCERIGERLKTWMPTATATSDVLGFHFSLEMRHYFSWFSRCFGEGVL